MKNIDCSKISECVNMKNAKMTQTHKHWHEIISIFQKGFLCMRRGAGQNSSSRPFVQPLQCCWPDAFRKSSKRLNVRCAVVTVYCCCCCSFEMISSRGPLCVQGNEYTGYSPKITFCEFFARIDARFKSVNQFFVFQMFHFWQICLDEVFTPTLHQANALSL